MTTFGKGNALEKIGSKKRAIALNVIKLQVSILMLIFKKVSIERKRIDHSSIDELNDWAKATTF